MILPFSGIWFTAFSPAAQPDGQFCVLSRILSTTLRPPVWSSGPHGAAPWDPGDLVVVFGAEDFLQKTSQLGWDEPSGLVDLQAAVANRGGQYLGKPPTLDKAMERLGIGGYYNRDLRMRALGAAVAGFLSVGGRQDIEALAYHDAYCAAKLALSLRRHWLSVLLNDALRGTLA